VQVTQYLQEHVNLTQGKKKVVGVCKFASLQKTKARLLLSNYRGYMICLGKTTPKFELFGVKQNTIYID
jgi:hypothetical protein